MAFPVRTLAFERAVRLLPSARLRDPVLLGLADQSRLDDLAEIEGATSSRLREEELGGGPAPNGRPHAKFVNAAFAYARPRELNRFNGPELGAWYAALQVETSLEEVIFHLTRELARVGEYRTTVEYAEMWASFAGDFVDLRDVSPVPECLHPDTDIGYPAGNLVASQARANGLNGIVYPSVRHAGGTCLVALWPHVVQSVAPGRMIRVVWQGSPRPTIDVRAG